MSLNWSVKDVKDNEFTWTIAPEDAPTMGISKGDEVWTPLTMAMVNLTMTVGIGKLTDEVAPEFYARVKLCEKLYGCFWYNGKGEHQEITWDDVQRYVGLGSNVSFESRTKFLKRHVVGELDDSVKFYHVRVAKQAAEEAWEQNTHDLNV